jgi:RNA polymerase sigma factor (sigma-70 family)
MDLTLFARYKAATGTEQAKLLNQIVIEGMPFVVRCVRKFCRGKYEANLDDLVQHGAIGYARGVAKWTPEKGAWSPFAKKAVLFLVKRAALKQHVVAVPQSRPLLCKAQVQAAYAIRARTGREATAEELRVAPEVLEEYRKPVSLAALDAFDNTSPEYETWMNRGDTGASQQVETSLEVMKALDILEARERRIVIGCIVEGKTENEMAAEEGVSNCHVHNLLQSSLLEMRNHLSQG